MHPHSVNSSQQEALTETQGTWVPALSQSSHMNYCILYNTKTKFSSSVKWDNNACFSSVVLTNKQNNLFTALSQCTVTTHLINKSVLQIYQWTKQSLHSRVQGQIAFWWQKASPCNLRLVSKLNILEFFWHLPQYTLFQGHPWLFHLNSFCILA